MGDDKIQLTDGSPVPEDRSHTELKENGQQKDYIVLSPEERAKGFIRPLRKSYTHIGKPGPEFPLIDLTEKQKSIFVRKGDDERFVKFEPYPEGHKGASTGRFWTQKDIDKIGKGCGTDTTMSLEIAETYARNPHFYGGTFCCSCRKHLPLEEFVWRGTVEIVGS